MSAPDPDPGAEGVPEPPPGHWLTREMLREVAATCIHTPGYGTRSATIAMLKPGGVTALTHAAGPPCVTTFSDVSELLAAG